VKVSVIIPVGPNHEDVWKKAARSVGRAWGLDHGPFGEMELVIVPDPEGQLGRSAARNKGMAEHPADWFFFLDADDEMMANAFDLVDLEAPATFGAVVLDGKLLRANRYPGYGNPAICRRMLAKFGASGTLSMGFFVRADLGLRFDESLDIAEDFDFYMRLPWYVKRHEPLANIHLYTHPRSGGPRAAQGDWTQACRAVIDRHLKAGA
jgi:hypothetical protein